MGTHVTDPRPEAIPDLNTLELTLETITRARFVALRMGTSLSQAVEFLLARALSEYEGRGLQEGHSGAYTFSPRAAPSASSATNTKATKAALMDSEAAADFLKCSSWTLAAWRCNGDGPRFCKLGNRVRYALADLEKWVEAHTANSTSEHDERKRKGE